MGSLGLRARLLLAFLLPALGLLSAGGYLQYRVSRNVLEDELGASLSLAAATLASQLKAERVFALEPDDAQGEGSRTFRSLTAQVQEARRAAGLKRVLVADLSQRAFLDVREGPGLPPRAEAPELLRDTGELARVAQGERAASQVLFEGVDGQLYKTGYAPLLQDGQVVGVVAVEGTATFFAPLTRLVRGFLGLAAGVLLVLALAAVLVTRTLSRPLERLVESALRIGGGDLVTAVPAEPTLEIGILARELEAMRRSLESRDRQLKLMLGGVAHEVKNPLGGIELFAGLLGEELQAPAPDTQEARSHLSKIQRELEYLKRIVEDFLAFAREQKLNTERLDAQAWVESACAHLAGEAQGKAVTLKVEAAGGLVRGDGGLLTSALVNLVKNAVQASPSGTTVEVRGAIEGHHYVVRVRDEGGGIPPEQQEHVFEPFFTTREKGTGLGLPLARKLVEAHGGRLELTSRPGATEFTVTLPRALPLPS